MPIYEYRCRGCGELFESLQSRADDPAPKCPKCGRPDVARQLSVFAVSAPRAAQPAGPCGSPDCACRRP
jgi:putative FmdB family regulatory protein